MSDVDVSVIRAGDVLLFHGNGFVSWAIRKIDGTDVNHVAIALDPMELAEAGGNGLQRRSIAEAVQGNKYMFVRRHGEAEVAPVVKAAEDYLNDGKPYAYQQIVLLALIASTRKIPLGGVARRMLRSVLDHAAAALNSFIDSGGARSMICSEYVYRVFREAPAATPEKYRLRIRIGDQSFDPTAMSLAEWALGQPDETLEAAASAPVSFSVTPMAPAEADEIAEEDLAPLIAEWAVENDLVDEDMPPPPPPSFDLAEDEPTDEELLASLVTFSTAFETAVSEEPPSFGIGVVIGGAAAKGAIQGLLKPDIESNFVTPGDLLLSPTLTDVGRVRGGG